MINLHCAYKNFRSFGDLLQQGEALSSSSSGVQPVRLGKLSIVLVWRWTQMNTDELRDFQMTRDVFWTFVSQSQTLSWFPLPGWNYQTEDPIHGAEAKACWCRPGVVQQWWRLKKAVRSSTFCDLQDPSRKPPSQLSGFISKSLHSSREGFYFLLKLQAKARYAIIRSPPGFSELIAAVTAPDIDKVHAKATKAISKMWSVDCRSRIFRTPGLSGSVCSLPMEDAQDDAWQVEREYLEELSGADRFKMIQVYSTPFDFR